MNSFQCTLSNLESGNLSFITNFRILSVMFCFSAKSTFLEALVLVVFANFIMRWIQLHGTEMYVKHQSFIMKLEIIIEKKQYELAMLLYHINKIWILTRFKWRIKFEFTPLLNEIPKVLSPYLPNKVCTMHLNFFH